VKFKEPDKKWIWGGLPERIRTEYFRKLASSRKEFLCETEARGLQHETEKSKRDSN
jgi:hypothetical protein